MTKKLRVLAMLALCSVVLGACSNGEGSNESNDEGQSVVTNDQSNAVEIAENSAHVVGDVVVRVFNFTQDTIMVGVERPDSDDSTSTDMASSIIGIGETVEVLGLRFEILELNKGAPAERPGATNSNVLLRIEEL